MARYLDLGEQQRREHVARLLGLSPNHPESWPLTIIDAAISESEHAAEQTLQNRVRYLNGLA